MTESNFERAANSNTENNDRNIDRGSAHERGGVAPDIHTIIAGMQEDRSVTGAPNKFFTHEALPGELIRFEPYGDQHVAEMSVAYTERALAEYQEKYGIPVVNHQHYVVDGDHYVRVEKLEGAIPLNRVMQEGVTDPSLAAEISEAGAKLAKHVEDVIKEGGVVNPEHTHLGQFAVLPDRPEGGRVVFIDIEALNPQVVPKTGLEVGYRHDSAVVALIQLAEGVAVIKESTPGVALDAVEIAIAQAFDALPATNMPEEVSRVREDIVQAMVLGDREVFDEIAAGTDEAETERVVYWNNYVEQGGLTPVCRDISIP